MATILSDTRPLRKRTSGVDDYLDVAICGLVYSAKRSGAERSGAERTGKAERTQQSEAKWNGKAKRSGKEGKQSLDPRRLLAQYIG
jgi:hypothetical protein